ncbi:putative Phosphatidylinositol N acetylglucosaminyltransferase [Trypanosoma vivax]|uniref:Putative phosphatidylinositolN-acetylglucosaminyltransferase subunit c n=1 Tax=Trypanosoma vivax (strain Y486) TaxID=1055687 RepID=G0U6Q6_TRYVY|nr:putative phosphatidylinositolN-acetylglucosaminyltransferase subunit c [Trypanosoma vivax]KAH8611200.1 putative Phosphatidylinositol N acetylglucosaminyltransferase [Trypanosoma vivax]CCC51560.1 putative phosphatidylinositolN-acetylglucosaminyltransferase subunit c [Trypanosoma vivax Y486]
MQRQCDGAVHAACVRESGRLGTATGRARVWRKVLYTRQPYEDNYVDPQQFLQDLRQNVSIATYKYSHVVMDTLAVIQQLSFVTLFLAMFWMIFYSRIDECVLMWTNVSLFAMSFAFFAHLQRQQALERGKTPVPFVHCLVEMLKRVAPLVSVLILLSPVLQTLTVTYSNDTIAALTVISMCVHLLLTDYNYLNCYSEKYQQNAAINAATFANILVASRIHSPLKSGTLITFGILCFSLSPIPRHHLKRHSLTAHVVLTFLVCGFAVGTLLLVPVLAVVYCFVLLVVALVIPWCFVTLHNGMKDQINGPWDEARPTNSAAAEEWANAGLLQ